MIKRYINPSMSEWPALCERVVADDAVIAGRVDAIIERVRRDGDNAIRELASEIDGVQLAAIEVSEEEKREAFALVPQDLKDAIAKAARNITRFHMAQRFNDIEVVTSPGVKCVQRAVPIQRVGLYVPGGTAPLFSTVLMLAIPAKVAGCKEIVLCTPVNKQGKVAPAVLSAAMVCGVDHIYKVGGAQAVAAMAYGTETIPAVDKIFGPGNRYVTKAKERVTNRVSIDMPAGPSEVLVMADATASPAFVASDLLSQAEHGVDSQAVLVCGNSNIADAVVAAVAEQITAAGSVFIGNYSPESAGDYASGTNHTLPTSGWARSCSGVNLDSFVRKITYQELTEEGICELGDTIVTMAKAEGLDAHAAAALLRMGKEL